MASAPGSDRRPRTLRRVVRRLIGRPVGAPPASAGLVGALPVRKPWPLLRWWHRMFRRSTISRSGGAAATTTADRISLTRPLTPARRPLARPRDRGPLVRPGHDLRLRPALSRDAGLPIARRGMPPTSPVGGVHLPGKAPGRASADLSASPRPGAGAPTVPTRPAAMARGRVFRSGAGRGSAPAARPAPGPSVGNPQPVGYLRVLGAAPMPPGVGPDPMGAVMVGPPATGGAALGAVPGAVRAKHGTDPGHGAGLRGGSGLGAGSGWSRGSGLRGDSGLGGGPGPGGGFSLGPGFSPAAAVRPGPGSRPGRHGGTSSTFVSGTASPRARWEAAVAARPLEAPRSLPAALHPMASAITGRSRPPLFTTGPATRRALAAAGALGATTGTVIHLPSAPAPGPSVSAVLAHELTHTRSPVRRPRFFLGGVSSLLDDDERSALAAGRSAVSGLAGRGRQAADGLIGQGRQAAEGLIGQAGSTAAGIVDSLPVGGGLGAVGDVATRAARAAVMEAAASPISAVSGLADQASGLADRAGGLASGVLDRASGLASGVADTASRYAEQATDAVGGRAAQASSAVAEATGAAKNALDPDKIVEIVEQRLLREIERRGGRWAGVF